MVIRFQFVVPKSLLVLGGAAFLKRAIRTSEGLYFLIINKYIFIKGKEDKKGVRNRRV
jgi:hypothetical protein